MVSVVVFLAASDLRETSVSEAGSLGIIVAGFVVRGDLAVTFAGFRVTFAVLSSLIALFLFSELFFSLLKGC